MAWSPLLRCALVFVFAFVYSACGARSALKEPRDGAVTDAPVIDVPVVDTPVIDTPVIDVPVDIPVRDLPVIDVRDVPDVPVRDIPPVDVPVTVTAVCPASQHVVETAIATLAGSGSHSLGLPLTYAWVVEAMPPGVVTPGTLINATMPTAGLLASAPGTWRVRLTVSDAAGRSNSCVTAVEVDAGIVLVCPNDQSRYQSDVATLSARAASRLGRPLSYAWALTRRPAGSAATITPPTGSLETRMPCDALGDYTVQLTATDGTLTRSCNANVHVDPDVLVTCPPDITSVPFTTVRLEGNATSRLSLPITYRWTIESAPPTSTGSLTTPNERVAGFMFDVAGDWVWRLTASNSRGNSASCTTRAFARSDEAVRVEAVWNLDRSCRSCNPMGGGIDIDLHLSDLSRSMLRWGGNAPDNSDCYYGNCRCDRTVGMLCPDGILQWAPPGAVNNPQLDVDHISDLPGPENINVTNAAPGTRFAVGVHYYGGSEATPVVVRVYCGGVVVFESERVILNSSGGSSSNPVWHVGDITVGGDGRACSFSRCGRAGALTECIRPHDEW